MIRVLGSTVPYSSPACSAAGALYRRLVGAAPALALDLAETADVRLIKAVRTHALCSPMHQQLQRTAVREPAAQRSYAPRHPAMVCPTQR